MVIFSSVSSNLAHTPSLRASLGQVPYEPGPVVGGQGDGVGVGLCVCLCLGLWHGDSPHAVTVVKRRMLERRNRASDLERW